MQESVYRLPLIKLKLSQLQKSNFVFWTLFFFSMCLHAQVKDSITVQLNKTVFAKGDSIEMEVNLQNYASVAKAATIQLWIEEIKTGRQWKFRYPLVNGYLHAKLKIDSALPNGTYAFNFLLQKTFFNITGTVQNVSKKVKQLNYLMISKNKQMMLDVMPLSEQHSFSVRNLLFQDSAFIIFSRPKQKKNDLLIDISTPLDSSFVPAAINTQLINIGSTDSLPRQEKQAIANYVFKPDNTKYKIILPEVIITAKSKKLEDFANENTTGMFTGDDAIMLDGLGSDEIANAPDLYTYLTTKVGGLRLVLDSETGSRSFVWRNQPTDIFINEIRLDPDIPMLINPSDIAMIKIFRPGTSLGADASPGGAIAIYTKTGKYIEETNRRYSFFILGYTGVETTWK